VDKSERFVRKRMVALGLTSWELMATSCGLDRGTLWRYAMGQQLPRIDQVERLCDGLEVTPEQLLRGFV
jgi:transcriptional regulator with XRE-family HTH domain